MRTPNGYSDSEFVKVRDEVTELRIDVARLQTQKEGDETALELAKKASDHAQAASNEWRKENIDQRALFTTKNTVDGLMAEERAERRALEARVKVIETVGSKDEGKHSAFDAIWVKVAVIATLALSLYKLFTGK
jgi:hypothetical protein